MKFRDSEISITFCLEGREVRLNEISKRLCIIPSRTRTPDDWPEAIRNPKMELPDELKPRYTWELNIDYKNCNLVRDQFKKMIEMLKSLIYRDYMLKAVIVSINGLKAAWEFWLT